MKESIVNTVPAAMCKGCSNTLVEQGLLIWGGRRVSNEVQMPVNGVRRLTPLECERLQGLPDNWTLVDEKSSDTARYKAIGNGMAQPCADFILAVVNRMSEE